MARASQLVIAATVATLNFASVAAHETDEDFGNKVRSYLLENPEVLLDVMEILASQEESRAMRDLLRPHVSVIFGADMDLRMGADDAPKVLVEFFDYNCAVCKENMPAMQAFVPTILMSLSSKSIYRSLHRDQSVPYDLCWPHVRRSVKGV